MFKELKAKLLAGLTACACVFAGAGVSANAAKAESGLDNPSVAQNATAPFTQGRQESEAYSIEIVSKNLSYSDALYILYAVDYAGFDESQNEIKMLFWDSLQTEYTVDTASVVKSAEYFTTLGGRECIVFYSDGISAKSMNDNIYCRAYATVDGMTVYSDVEKYSVVDYVYDKRADGGLSSEQTAIFADMLQYGASAQRLFGHNTELPANATYYTITVENGVLDDGFTWGRYLPNATATLIAPEQNASGEPFACWVNNLGNQVGNTATLSLDVKASECYTAVYGEISNTTPASAFEYTSDGSAITITKYIGDYTDVVIPSIIDGLPVTSIFYAFSYCNSLTSVVMPESLTSIGAWAFACCSGLTSVVIPEGVMNIGDEAFLGCSSLTSVAIPNSVTSIGFDSFGDCRSLTSVVIPDSVTSIDGYAFEGCRSLTSVVIPDSVTSIGSEAFYNCSKLTSVVIPDSVTSIDVGAFYKCSSLTIYCEAESQPDGWRPDWNPDNRPVVWGYGRVPEIPEEPEYSVGLAYSLNSDGAGYTVTGVGECTDTDIIIPSTYNGLPVTSIGWGAFYYCSGLTSVVIGDCVTSIRDFAVYYCSSLTSVVIPDGVKSIGDWVFAGCDSLTSVVIGDGVTGIGDSAFSYCGSLVSVVIPNSVTSIGESAFTGCDSLTSFTVGESNTAYQDIDGNLYTKDGVMLIQYATGKTAAEFIIPSSVTTIGLKAFRGCTSLVRIIIQDSVICIGSWAFENCSNLTSVIIPDSVTTIGAYVFNGCSNFTICCEAESQPEGWDSNWNNFTDCPIVWGYKGE